MHQPGSNIRNLRVQLGLKQIALAKAADVDQGTLSNIERGKGGYSKETIDSIAKALNVSVGTLFADGMTVDAASLGMRRIPVITEGEVAEWRGLEMADFDWDVQEFLFGTLTSVSRYAFALRIKDVENAPMLIPGDHAIFDLTVQPWPGALVVATDKKGRTAVGRFRDRNSDEDGPGFDVFPANEFFAPASSRSKSGLTIKGVAAEFRRYQVSPK